MHLSGLHIYPVKSLRGISVPSAEVDAQGLVGDRRFLVIDSTGKFLTQRTLPRMALIDTALSSDTLTLSTSTANHAPISVSRASDPAAPLRTVSVWKAEGLQAEDCGAAAATWLSDFLATPVRLVRAGAAFHRPVNKPGKALPDDVTTFADAQPFMAIGEASLDDLNDRIVARDEDAVPMNRFRPNLVFSGTAPFAEDTWPRFRIGGIVFRSGGPCIRCILPTTDQLTAVRGKEPLRTLASYRRVPGSPSDVIFGQNLYHETKQGTLRVGDPIELLA